MGRERQWGERRRWSTENRVITLDARHAVDSGAVGSNNQSDRPELSFTAVARRKPTAVSRHQKSSISGCPQDAVWRREPKPTHRYRLAVYQFLSLLRCSITAVRHPVPAICGTLSLLYAAPRPCCMRVTRPVADISAPPFLLMYFDSHSSR